MEHRDDDDDDDVSFAKWMSSFWGHSWREKDERGLRDHHRPQEASYRKASLPCPRRNSPQTLPIAARGKEYNARGSSEERVGRLGQVRTLLQIADTFPYSAAVLEGSTCTSSTSQFPAFPSITPPDCHPRRHSHEDQGSRSHLSMRYHRKCSVDGSFKEPVGSQRGAHSKIQEFSESFEQHLCLQTKHPPSSGPKGRKERNERHCLGTDVRSHKKMEDRRNSTKEAHGDAPMAPLIEKGPE